MTSTPLRMLAGTHRRFDSALASSSLSLGSCIDCFRLSGCFCLRRLSFLLGLCSALRLVHRPCLSLGEQSLERTSRA
ncbi:uncharacterized protein BDV17DRAFT_262684 [Aspergillus undulatus]|uniref:uncharacterized protein n=1 Tax=Aspergillus undulatus TaxID=1810928 RepID=UPI003CCE31C4